MSRYDNLGAEARAVLDEMDELTMAEVIVSYGAALDRVRSIHTHGPRTNTCNEDGANWPCDTIRAITGDDTPKEP